MKMIDSMLVNVTQVLNTIIHNQCFFLIDFVHSKSRRQINPEDQCLPGVANSGTASAREALTSCRWRVCIYSDSHSACVCLCVLFLSILNSKLSICI